MNNAANESGRDHNQIIIALTGELDASTCLAADHQFEEALAASPTSVLVDCCDLEYISSAGLGVLIAFHHACQEKGVPVAFCGMNSKVKNVLSILGLDKLFTLENSIEEGKLALEAVKK